MALDERLGARRRCWPGCASQVADEKVEVAAERTRRLDSDAAAVQLVTIHGSKGLEYPVVYLPDPVEPLHRPTTRRSRSSTTTQGDRCRDVGGREPVPGRRTSPRHWARGRRASRCGCSTSRSPAPSPRWSPGRPRPATTPRLARCTGCCSGAGPARPTVPDEQAAGRRRPARCRSSAHWRDAGGPWPELAAHAAARPDAARSRPADALAVRRFTRTVDTPGAGRRTPRCPRRPRPSTPASAASHEPEDVPERRTTRTCRCSSEPTRRRTSS